jgi:diguanylate cyclase
MDAGYKLAALILIALGAVALALALRSARRMRAQTSQPLPQFRLALPALIFALIACYIAWFIILLRHDVALDGLAVAATLCGAACILWAIAQSGRAALREAVRIAALERHRADHDALTGLPNRLFFMRRLARSAERAADRQHFAVLIIDLNRFKLVNDTLGHAYGDGLLREFGRRLQGSLRMSDLVARLGGDEFGILINPIESLERARNIAGNLAATLQGPIVVGSHGADVSVSIGIAGFPEHGAGGNALMKNAEIAMDEAKRRGVGIMLYDPGFDTHDVEQLNTLGELRRAIEADALEVYYQPQFSPKTGKMTGAEALVRWPHSHAGLLLPTDFIDLAEQSGLINRLNRRVLDIVFDQLAAWRAAGLDTPIATNVSALNLQDPGLFEYIVEGLRARHLSAAQLKLEITETAVVSDPDAARALTRLAEFGVRLSIDDFGTGYSSLVYLRELPVGEIKIDRSFVVNLTRDNNDAILVRSTIELAHNLGRAVIAEGVESREALELLTRWGCDAVQGFHLSPPLVISDLDRKLKDPDWRPLVPAPAN